MKTRVLVIDDDVSICRIDTIMLERLGYDAVTANTGEEGIRIYAEALKDGSPFRVVMLDLTLGEGIDGIETLAQLKKLDPDVCAVASSGSSAHALRQNCLEHGFKGALPKPFRMQDVARCLEELIGKSQP